MSRWTLLPSSSAWRASHPVWSRQFARAVALPSAAPGLHGAMPSRMPYAQCLAGGEQALIADLVVAQADATGARIMRLGIDALEKERSLQLQSMLERWLPAEVSLEEIRPGRWLLRAPGQNFRGLGAIDPEGVLGAQLTHWLPQHLWLAKLCNELQMALATTPDAAPWNMLWCWGETCEVQSLRSIVSEDPLLRALPIAAEAALDLLDWRILPADAPLPAGHYRSLDGSGWRINPWNAWRARVGF